MTGTASPRFSIISAVYDVEPYLPEFIASVERQAHDGGPLEVIAVDDGSTDGSLALLHAWRDRGTVPVTVVSQPNAGQGAARNAGIELATGAWVTFTDPDDVLEPGYLAAAAAFAGDHPDVAVLSGKRMTFDEGRGAVRDGHPRRWQFADGSRVADLAAEPNVFPVSASTAFFRADRLRATGLRYDPDLRPHFEDQHFAARYLLGLERPLVGLVADARYDYRVRLANDSSLQRLHADPRSYTTVFERGYLDLVRRSREARGDVAPWIQQLLLYELTRRYLREADANDSRLHVPAGLEERFRELFGELARSLDPEQVYAHSASRLEGIWAELLVHGYRDLPWIPTTVDRTAVDGRMGLQRLAYRYRGSAPAERLEIGGRVVEPPFAKVRAVSYFGRTELEERVLWVPASPELRMALDGTSVAIGAPRAPIRAVDARRGGGAGSTSRRGGRGRPRLGAVRTSITRLLDGTLRRGRFRGAWVLIDGVDAAGGEAERLFAHLRRERPDINAWFAVGSGTPDWRRLQQTDGPRLVAHGGARWRSLLEDATWLVSSEADDRIVRPRARGAAGAGIASSFVLLRPGAADPDSAAALDRLPIGMLAVRTDAEIVALAGDGTRTGLTRKEVRRTGLPGDGDDACARVVAELELLGRPWADPVT